MTAARFLALLALAAVPLAGTALAGELPSDARITYDALYGDSQFRIGRAEQHWHVEAGHYELQTQLVPLIGPNIRYVSKGRLTEHGLVPESFAEYRNDETQPRVRAEFDWDKRQVLFGRADENRTAALERGAQDVNALAFQLAWLGEQARGVVQVATGKKVARYSFGSSGRVQVTVNGQKSEAQQWRSDEGRDRTEVWVAPRFANLPVRVIRADDDKQLQLVAREVRVNGAAPKP